MDAIDSGYLHRIHFACADFASGKSLRVYRLFFEGTRAEGTSIRSSGGSLRRTVLQSGCLVVCSSVPVLTIHKKGGARYGSSPRSSRCVGLYNQFRPVANSPTCQAQRRNLTATSRRLDSQYHATAYL